MRLLRSLCDLKCVAACDNRHANVPSVSGLKSEGIKGMKFSRFHFQIKDSSRFTSTSLGRFVRLKGSCVWPCWTGWSEICPLNDESAESVAWAFYARWLFRFGTPGTITTDQATYFESALFRALRNLNGCMSKRLIERRHRSFKASLMCHEDRTNWVHLLPTVMVGLRNSFKDDIGSSSAELVLGSGLWLVNGS